MRDFAVGDLLRLIEGLALHPLGRERARSDGRAAAEGLELCIGNLAVRPDLDLQLHHVAAGGRADQAGADIALGLVEGTDVARIVVVIEQLFAIGHVRTPSDTAIVSGNRDWAQCSAHSIDLMSIPSWAISQSGLISRSRLTAWTMCSIA